MARIIILDKAHLGSGKFAVRGIFKFTKAADSIGVAGTPTLRDFDLPVTVNLATATTRVLRRAAIIAALTPACAQIKAMIAAEEAKFAALTDNAADFDLDLPTDNGTDIGSV